MTMEASRNCVHAKNSVDSSRSGHGGRRPFLTSLGVGLHGMRVLCEYIGFEKFEDDVWPSQKKLAYIVLVTTCLIFFRVVEKLDILSRRVI
jgi:hypothetical protein